MKAISSIFFAASLSFAFPMRAGAAVVIQFQEVGGDVIASTTGSFFVPLIGPFQSATETDFHGTSSTLFNLAGNYDAWEDGSHLSSGSPWPPTSATGDTFGYQAEVLYLPAGLTGGELFTPNTTWTWAGETLESLELDYLTSTPTLIYTAASEAGGDTISFARAVPEPSTAALLLGAGTLVLGFSRRRYGKP